MRARPQLEHSTTVRALVVRCTAYGESDSVVQLLAHGRGRLGAFARGARRSQKRYGGALEPFGLIDAEISERRGSDLFDLRGAVIVDPHLAVRADLSRLAHAGYALEIARELMRERQANDALFDLVLAFLGGLREWPAKSVLLRSFELKALAAAGFAPVLGACARCGLDLRDAARPAFDPAVGGTACDGCAGPYALRLDTASHRLLIALQTRALDTAALADEAGLPLDPVRRALHAFLAHHVAHELKSASFLREVGAPP